MVALDCDWTFSCPMGVSIHAMTLYQRLIARMIVTELLMAFYFYMVYSGVEGYAMSGLVVGIGVLLWKNRRDIREWKVKGRPR